MPDNRRVQRNSGASNSSSNPSGRSIEEAIKQLGIQTDGKEDDPSMAYPDRPGEPDCIYYLRTGVCGYGDKCRFNHPNHIGQVNQNGGDFPERVGEPDCAYFLKTGTCKYGSTCKYNHPRDNRGAGPVVLNMIGLPMRQGQKSCAHYVRTGSCKFGATCKFHHPQPAPDGSNGPSPPVPGTAPYAPPHITGVTAWPYQAAQTYVPMVPTQPWSPYVLTPTSNLPERPGEPECRYFMNTGTCKYGPDCKYHHPSAESGQMVASSLSPLGLPLRPGQPVCSFYSVYGICKYGPTCKYDHPLLVYSYNYTMGLPGVSILGPSGFPYGGPTIHSSESSSSEPTSNGKLCTDDLGERVGSSSGSSSRNQSD